MNFYKVPKSKLIWLDMPQTKLDVKSPIIINEKFEVIFGNCLKDREKDFELVIMLVGWEYYKTILVQLEKEIFKSDDPDLWISRIDRDAVEFIKNETIVNEQIDLLIYRTHDLLTEENYKKGGMYDFIKAKNKGNKDDGQIKLIEFEDEIKEVKGVKVKKSEDKEIEIDMEIMKELL